MNTKKRTIAALGAVAVIVGAAAGAQAATTSSAPSTSTAVVTATADKALAESLQRNREEERMARDLYAALAKVHDGARPMSMITNAEDHHYDAVGVLLERYGVSDPSTGKAAGTYAYPEVQKLYDQWYAQGKSSVNAAYQVGVALEKADIAQLKKDVAATSETDVKQVYNNLLAASEHHLDAFEAAASGEALPANGRMGGMGPGNGQGPGNGTAGQHGRGPGNGMGPGNGQGLRDGSCLTTTPSS